MTHTKKNKPESKLALHWKILIGMLLGIIVGVLSIYIADDAGRTFIVLWIKPFGTIFLNILKLLAVPLVIASLIKGVTGLKDIARLSSMGGRTIMIYLLTTVVAVSIGLVLVNTLAPGNVIDETTRTEFIKSSQGDLGKHINTAAATKEQGPLQAIVDLVPQNIFKAVSSNASMLQVIFFVVFFGIGLILIPHEQARPVLAFFESIDEVILKMIDLVMLVSPLGVFALLAALIVESPSPQILIAVGAYMGTVILGLAIMGLVVYPLLVYFFTGRSFMSFFKGILPAQLVAFSTSSSAATLPVTMERVTEHLGVDEDVSSFVLPVGATINMDGTSLYQGVAAVFIAQVLGNDLSLADQLTILGTATLASIGSAAVPGAGMVMLIVVLQGIGVDPLSIGLIFGVDRPLDMLRTSINVTGDATVAMLVAKKAGKLHDPHVKDWDDYYPDKS